MEGNKKGNISKQMAPFNQSIYYGLKVQSSKPTVLGHVEVIFLWTIFSKISYLGIALLPFSITIFFLATSPQSFQLDVTSAVKLHFIQSCSREPKLPRSLLSPGEF